MKTKDVYLKTRVTKDEADNLKATAPRCGLTQSEFLRLVIKGRQPKSTPPEAFWEHMNTLYNIYNGLRNKAYSSGGNSDYARELQDTLEKEILRLQAAATLPGKAVILRGNDHDLGG